MFILKIGEDFRCCFFAVWNGNEPGAKVPLTAMSCEVKLNTLQGGVITLDIPMTATVRELKAMLLAKHPCRDPIERKILKVPRQINHR